MKDCEELKPKPKVERSGVLVPQPKREVELRGQKQKRTRTIGRSGVPQQTSIGA